MLGKHEVTEGVRRCRGAKSAPRSKERWLASGRQVEGKHQVAGNATLIHYPVGTMTRRPPSTMRKSSTQDSNGQLGEPRIAPRELIIQNVKLLSGDGFPRPGSSLSVVSCVDSEHYRPIMQFLIAGRI